MLFATAVVKTLAEHVQAQEVTNPAPSLASQPRVPEWIPFVEYRGKHEALWDWTTQGFGSVQNGVRGTGKTQLDADAIAYLIGQNFFQDAHLFCGKAETASQNLNLIKACLMHNNHTKFRKANAEILELPNGNTVQAHANTIADINKCRGLPGRKFIIWCDEANQLDRATYDNLFGFTSGVKDLLLILSGNLLGGDIESKNAAFSDLCQAPGREELLGRLNMAYFEFTQDDIWWTDDLAKSTTKMLLDIMGTENASAKQLSLALIQKEGKLYNLNDVDLCFSPLQFKREDCTSVICTIDWGNVHDTAILVTGIKDGMMVELFAWAHPFKDVRREHLTNVFREIKVRLHPDRILAERSANEVIGIQELQDTFQAVERVMWAPGDQEYWSKPQCAASCQLVVKAHKAALHSTKLKTQMKEIEVKHLSKQSLCPVGDDMHDAWMYNARVQVEHLGLLKSTPYQINATRMFT
jgi:hypothetical protein